MDITADQIKDVARRLDAAKAKGPITLKTVQDAWVEVWGDSTDPDMKRALLALSAATEIEGASTATAAPVAAEQDADSGDDPERMDAAAIEAEVKRRVDAELPKRVSVELEARADALAVARRALGCDYKHDGKSTAEMRLEVVRKVLPAKAKRIDRLDAADQRTAIALGFEDARDVLDAQLDYGERLAASINAERDRADAQGEVAPDLAEMAKRMDAQTKAAGSQSFGSQPRLT